MIKKIKAIFSKKEIPLPERPVGQALALESLLPEKILSIVYDISLPYNIAVIGNMSGEIIRGLRVKVVSATNSSVVEDFFHESDRRLFGRLKSVNVFMPKEAVRFRLPRKKNSSEDVAIVASGRVKDQDFEIVKSVKLEL